MKRILLFGIALVIILSFGGNIILAHAQTLTPGERAALEQRLDVMKATLINLQMKQAGQSLVVSAGPSVTVSNNTLSSADVVAISQALTSLKVALQSIQTQVAANPQFAATNGAVMAQALGNIGDTLAIIGKALSPKSTVGVVATEAASTLTPSVAQEATPPLLSAGQPVIAQAEPQATAVSPSAQAPKAAQTAQASSNLPFKNVNWPLVAVVILVVAAVAVWLWWPTDDMASKIELQIAEIAKPMPSQQVSRQPQSQPMQVQVKQASRPQTPFAAAMGTPTQKS